MAEQLRKTKEKEELMNRVKKQDEERKKRKREEEKEELIEKRKKLFQNRKERAAFIAKIYEKRLNSVPKKVHTRMTL